jgi:hypothetical protein
LRITIKSFYSLRARNTWPTEWIRSTIELLGFDLAWFAGNTDRLWITAGKSSCSKRRPQQQQERQQDLHFHIASPAANSVAGSKVRTKPATPNKIPSYMPQSEADLEKDGKKFILSENARKAA